jgi:DNA-binding ferritin-like protein (Dps family)
MSIYNYKSSLRGMGINIDMKQAFKNLYKRKQALKKIFKKGNRHLKYYLFRIVV